MVGFKPQRHGLARTLAMALLAIVFLAGIAQPAAAARYRGWGWGRGGYRAYRAPYRGYYRAMPRYGYGYGYRGWRAAPRTVYPGYYYGGPYRYGYGYGYGAPLMPAAGYYNFAPPMM
jgi:hypothetical protein